MEPITSKNRNDELYIKFNDRVDSSNAAHAGELIDAILAADPCPTVILDFTDLVYISSAGLRQILKVRKARPQAKIIGVSTDVYDILQMTGFTEMIPVEKAYRNISTEGCKMIGCGANGAVFRLDEDTILKVSLNPDALPFIHREQELARKAFILGIPTAISFDVVRVNGEKYGSVFELLDCQSLAEILSETPARLEEVAHIFVDLLKLIHSTEAQPGDMPDAKEDTLRWADFCKEYLPQDMADKLMRLVNEIPEDHHLIHGDYHAKNVMLQNGEALLIDMDTLSLGHPVIEFASIFNAYQGFSICDHSVIESFQKISFETATEFWKKVREFYFETTDPEFLQSVEDKAALVGYMRLFRRSIRREDQSDSEVLKAQEYFRKEILRLTEKLDTLLW